MPAQRKREDLLPVVIRRSPPGDDLIGTYQDQWCFVNMPQRLGWKPNDLQVYAHRLGRVGEAICCRIGLTESQQCPLRVEGVVRGAAIFAP